MVPIASRECCTDGAKLVTGALVALLCVVPLAAGCREMANAGAQPASAPVAASRGGEVVAPLEAGAEGPDSEFGRWTPRDDAASGIADPDQAMAELEAAAVAAGLFERINGDPKVGAGPDGTSPVAEADYHFTRSEGYYPPSELDPEKKASALGQVEMYAAAVFAPAFAPKLEEWRIYGVSRTHKPDAPVHAGHTARAPFQRSLALPAGGAVTLEGVAWLTESAAGLFARVAGEPVPDARLEALVPALALRWPPGYLDALTPSLTPLGTGTLWAAMGAWPEDAEGLDADGAWCFGSRAWSDGEWVVVSACAYPSSRLLRNRSSLFMFADFVDEPEHTHCVGRALFHDLPELERGLARIEPVREAGDLVFSVEARALAGLPRELRAETDVRALWAARLGPKSGLGLTLLPADAWADARLEPIPLAVAKRVPLEPGAAGLTTPVTDYPHVGSGVAGMLSAEDAEASPAWNGAVQWVLGDEKLAIVAVPRGQRAILGKAQGLMAGRQALARMLPSLLGPGGRAMTVAPVRMGKGPDGAGCLAECLGDAMVGPLADRRLGDQPWACASVYSDGGCVQLLFDLTEGESQAQ